MKKLWFLLISLQAITGFSQDTLNFDHLERKRAGVVNHYNMYYFQGTAYQGIAAKYRNQEITAIYELRDGKMHGTFKEFYPGGQLKTSTHYEDGRRDGECTYWYADGKKEAFMIYEAGFLVDTNFAWHPNGQLKKWSLEDGKGKWTLATEMYYESGQIYYQVTETSQKRWHANGQLAFTGDIVNHQSHGKLKYFDESGKLIKVETYKNGRKVKAKAKGQTSI